MDVKVDQTLDCRGLSCPMPILKMAKAIKDMSSGEVLEILGTDPGSKTDIPGWCEKTGNEFLGLEDLGDHSKFYIKKA
ncbi:sulfurtransferase TusA family protein [bacterium]|nr:sulfurtransferase TusA family protein [bacterium]